jgi:predicted acetyltransferase
VSEVEFQAQLDEPSYEPWDRWLVKVQGQVVAHLHAVRQEIRWAGQVWNAVRLVDLALLPEYRGQGCASALLMAVEQQLRSDGVRLALTQTVHPAFYRQHGWVLCGRHCYSLAGTREVLAQLPLPVRAPAPDAARGLPLHVRYLRQVEQAALMRLYDEWTSTLSGPLVRRPPYWRWLFGKQACERVYVAIEGSPKLELDDALPRLVGYAFVRGSRIVELGAAERRPDAAAALLARICGEAIESNLGEIRLDAPPQHPLHALLVAAGGVQHHREVEREGLWMARVFDACGLLQMLTPELLARARASTLPRIEGLGLQLDGEKYQLHCLGTRLGLRGGKLGRNYLSCTTAEFTRLLLGDGQLASALRTGPIESSSRRATLVAAALFPPRPIWFPPLDDLPA